MESDTPRVNDFLEQYYDAAGGWNLYNITRLLFLARDFERELNELKAKITWQPIETAPKDGAVMILGRSGSEENKAVSSVGCWIKALEDGEDYMGHDAGFSTDCGEFWCGRSFGNPEFYDKGCQPTHWMPLPEPPK